MTPIVLTKEAAVQIREALAGSDAAVTKLAAELKVVTEKAAALKVAAEQAEKTAAPKVDLSKIATDIAGRMLKQKLIGAQYLDKTAENLADPVKLAGYFQKALDLLEKQAGSADAPRRAGVAVKVAASAAEPKNKLADADRSFERAIGL